MDACGGSQGDGDSAGVAVVVAGSAAVVTAVAAIAAIAGVAAVAAVFAVDGVLPLSPGVGPWAAPFGA